MFCIPTRNDKPGLGLGFRAPKFGDPVQSQDYMRKKLQEEPTEWLDPEDEKYYMQGLKPYRV